MATFDNYVRPSMTRRKKKTAKKPVKKPAKKTHNDRIVEILAKVSEICDYAIDNLCTEPSQFEELECLLNDYVK